MRIMKTIVCSGCRKENQAPKRCDGLLHNAKVNTKEGESRPTRLQMWLKSENQNKAAFITAANRLWWHSGGADTRSRSEAIRSETITQNKHAAVCLWCHKHLWGRGKYQICACVTVMNRAHSYWSAAQVAWGHCTRCPPRLLPELEMERSARWHPAVPTEPSDYPQAASGAKRCRSQGVELLQRDRYWPGPFDLWPGYVHPSNRRGVPRGLAQ